MTLRRWTRVVRPSATPTGHYLGLPPALSDDPSERQLLPPASTVVISEEPDGVYIFRYGEDGSFVGDTWHLSVDDALEQLQHEFVISDDAWLPVDEDVQDLGAFVREVLSRDERGDVS